MISKIKGFRKIFVLSAIATLFVYFNQFAFADSDEEHRTTESHHETKEEKFNAGELIIGHITDEHGWHIAGNLSLPLPVILYSSEKGLSVFLSSKFDHGHKTYNGYMLHNRHIVAVNEQESVDALSATINEELTAQTWDLSITKNVFSIFITMGLMAWIFISAARMYARNQGSAPKGIQSFVEPLIIFVRDDIAKSSIGEKKYQKYLPFLLTSFFFIWFSNLLGLIPILPGGANVTGNIAVALTLATIVFIITTVSGNANYWKHILAMPGVPVGVLALLTPIEIIGVFLKPFVLMIRLFANIMAGHIIALSFFSLIFIFAEMNTGLGFGVSILSIAFTVFMGALELLVAFLQAYVFTLLAAMYFGAAVEEHHHDDHH
jgi:F-type H+-transporting ATPase subunit a